MRFSSYRFNDGLTRNKRRFCGLNPTSTWRRLLSVLRNRPAPTSSTSEIATWTMSSDLPRTLRDPTTPRLVSFSAELTFIPVPRNAGALPKISPVRQEIARTNSRTRQSSDVSCPGGPGSNCLPQ